MCLHSVTDREPKPEETGIGWKVIDFQRKYFSGPFFNQERHPFGEWVKAVPYKAVSKKADYTPGFHIFLSEKDAEIYLKEFIRPMSAWPEEFSDFHVFKVEYKGVLCRGITRIRNYDLQCLDWYLPTLVVENMLVPEMD
jgi:hypothetical protein